MKRIETFLCPARVVVGALRGPFETGLLRRRPSHARKGSLVLLGAWWSGLGPCRAQASETSSIGIFFVILLVVLVRLVVALVILLGVVALFVILLVILA